MERTHTEYRIFGPPGCGKTTEMSRQIGRAAEKHGSDRVLVASFTRAAAAELVGRNLPVERDMVGTLHAHCYRLLGRPTIAETEAEEFSERYPDYRLSLGDARSVDEPSYERKGSRDEEYPGDALYEAYGLLRAQMADRRGWPDGVKRFAHLWENWKETENRIDFTDMIALALNETDAAPGSPVVGFFDEVQDFTPLELALVRKWAGAMDYAVLAGDDDQTIYQFKGATPTAFLQPALAPEFKRVLSQSWRVPRAVQREAEAWISRVAEREPKVYRPRDEEGAVRHLADASWMLPDALIYDLQGQIAAGRECMVLASCSYMLGPTLGALRTAGIAYHNPYRRNRGDWNPLASGRGISTVDRVLAFLRPDWETWGEESRIWTPQDLKAWTKLVRATGVLRRGATAAIEALAGTAPVMDRDLRLWLEEEAYAAGLAGSLAWLEQHAASTYTKRLPFPLAIARKHGPAALRQPPRVKVGTIHSVKGGESDVVYLFPDLSRAGFQEWIGGRAGQDAIRRCFYVGMTRARHELVICGSTSAAAVDL